MSQPAKELESRIGLRSLDRLLEQRAKLVEQVAPLRAKHAAFGTYQDIRKIELAKVAAMIRAVAQRDQVKLSESAIDDQAHTHPGYVEFVTVNTTEKAQWIALENRIQSINDIILRENALVRFLAAEAHL